MTPFTVLILICKIGIAVADCRPDTARASVKGPRAPNEIVCGQLAQFTISNTAAEVRPEPGKEYLKIVCSHTGIAPVRKSADLQ
jgi:hypothetical protein